jgi:hypothetical protein
MNTIIRIVYHFDSNAKLEIVGAILGFEGAIFINHNKSISIWINQLGVLLQNPFKRKRNF